MKTTKTYKSFLYLLLILFASNTNGQIKPKGIVEIGYISDFKINFKNLVEYEYSDDDLKAAMLAGDKGMFIKSAERITKKYELLKKKYPCYNTRNSLSIFKSINMKKNKLNHVYKSFLKSNKINISGKIVYHLWISGRGELFKIEMIESDVKSDKLDEHFQKVLRKIKFERLINECDTTVVKSYYEFK